MAERARVLGRRASLHERTVQQVAAKGVSRRGRSRPPRQPAAVVEETIIDSRVWQLARELAGDDPLRIEVVGPEAVVVHNNRAWSGRG